MERMLKIRQMPSKKPWMGKSPLATARVTKNSERSLRRPLITPTKILLKESKQKKNFKNSV